MEKTHSIYFFSILIKNEYTKCSCNKKIILTIKLIFKCIKWDKRELIFFPRIEEKKLEMIEKNNEFVSIFPIFFRNKKKTCETMR